MARLPTLPKKLPRDIPFSIRITSVTKDNINLLCKVHGLTQGDVIEILVAEEVKEMAKGKLADKKP